MVAVTFTADTPAPPDVVIAALTDFSPRRVEVWPNIDAEHFTVHEVGNTWAEVTEGSAAGGGVWERARYDWSKPGIVRLTVVDSNVFTAGSFWQYTISPQGSGSRVVCSMQRTPRNFKGRLIALAIKLVGVKRFKTDLLKALDRANSRA